MKKLVLFKNFGLKSILILGLLFLFSNNSWGQTIYLDEPFTTGFPFPAASSSSTANNWTTVNGTGTMNRTVIPPLVYPASGTKFVNSGINNGLFNNYTGGSGGSTVSYKTFTGTPINSGVVYLSFIYQCTAKGGSQSQVIQLSDTNSAGGGATVWCAGDATNVRLGITRSSTVSGDILFYGTAGGAGSLALNSINFVVLKYDFSSNKAFLYINPTIGGSDPGDSGATLADAGTGGTAVAPRSNFSYLRLNGGGNNKAYFNISGVRVSSTWGTAVAAILDTPTTSAATSIGNSSFTANWSTVSNASSYTLNVYQSDGTTLVTSYTGITTNSYTVNSGLSSGTTYKYKVKSVGNQLSFYNSAESSAESLTTTSSNPFLTVGSISAGFGSQYLNSTTGPNSFTISGSLLTTDDVTVGALNGFTYSTTSGGTYTSTLSIVQTGGTFSQTVYVKFTPTLSQSYNGNIVIGGGGTTSTVNCAVTGIGLSVEPTAQATNLTFANNSTTGFIVNWTNASSGGGTNHLVVIKAASDITINPTDATSYTPNATFASGSGLSGGYVIYNGTGNTVTVTGLTRGTKYYVKIYDFNVSTAGSENYLVTAPSSGNQTTIPGEITSAQSGPWATAATWTGNVVPTQYDNVTIGAGHTIDIGATSKCNNLTIPTSTKVWATVASTLQLYGTSLVCNGTFGDVSNTSSLLTLQFGGNLTISGSGGIYPYKVQPVTLLSNIGVTFSANTEITYTSTAILSDNTGNNNVTYTVTTGKTLTVDGNWNTASSSSTNGTANTTINIDSGATATLLKAFALPIAFGKTCTLNINGTLNGGTSFSPYSYTTGAATTVNVNGTFSVANLNITPVATTVAPYIEIAPIINVGTSGSITVSGIADFSNTSLVGYVGNTASTTGGTFTLSSSGHLKLANASGVEPVSGPIRTTTRNFNSGSSYSFVGINAQVNGADLPSSISNLTINNAAGMTLGKATDLTGKLTVTAGTFNTGGFLTLKSVECCTAAVAQVLGAISGNVTVERYIPLKRAWRALTSPVNTTNSIRANWQEGGTGNGVNGIDIWSTNGGTGILTGGSGSSLLAYNSSTGWSGITNTTTASSLLLGSVNKPFMVFVTGPFGTNHVTNGAEATTIRATGALLTGDQTYTNVANQYTFIGNPYASPLNPVSMLAETSNADFGGNIWVWDANISSTNSVGNFNLFANGTYSNLTSNINVTATTQIQSGQAFFVKSTTGGPFTIKETHKGATTSNAVFRTEALPELLRVGLYKQVNNEWSGRDGAMTVILADADANQAQNKMANSTENIAFTKNGASFASNHHLPLVATDVLNVKVWNTSAGANYKLKINTEEFTATSLEATLEDLFTNARTPLALDGTAVEYPFTVTADALSTGDRFRIVFQSSTLATNIPKANGFSIVPNPVTGDSFQVNLGSLKTGIYSYSICNAIGQEVGKGSFNNAIQNTNYEIKMSNSASGIYLMKIKGEDNTAFTAKIIKK